MIGGDNDANDDDYNDYNDNYHKTINLIII